jgi:hypothetical protein
VGTGFPKRSCSNKKIERDGDSTKSHLALGERFNEQMLDSSAMGERVIVPDGQKANQCLVPSAKIFRFTFDPNHIYIYRHPASPEGRFAIVTNVGLGCDGRKLR